MQGSEIGALAAFLIGLLGSIHCVGMCGGIVGALTLGLPSTIKNSVAGMFAYLLAYNIGRITSYAVAGALAGTLGHQFYSLTTSTLANQVGHWLSGLFMIALGIYLAGWTRILSPLERLGSHAWRKIEPLSKKFLPVHHPGQALGLGLVWGWLPCGLVYSVLVWAMVAGDTILGAQIMVAFGLGTLPMLLLMGATARWFGSLVRRNWFRRAIGVIIVALGLMIILTPNRHHHMDHGVQGRSHSASLGSD